MPLPAHLDRLDVHLVTEGTYPHHRGGVSVWCDQLVRGLPERRFAVSAICASGRERAVWQTPGNVSQVRSVPLWGELSRGGRLRGVTGRRVDEAYERLLEALLDLDAGEAEFRAALQELHALGRGRDLSKRLRGDRAIRALQARWIDRPLDPRPSARASWAPTVADALVAVDTLEHLLRPLWAPPLRAGVTHCVSNGLPVLLAMAAKWENGTPVLLTEHGLYLRERYLGDGGGALPARALRLRFYKMLTGAAYQVADLITPGSEYNLRWQVQCGADPAAVLPVHNGVDPAAFPALVGEPDHPTLSWVGRVDPLKDVETLIRGFDLVRGRVERARLRMFGPTPPGNEAYHARCEAVMAELQMAGVASFDGMVPAVTDAYGAGHVVVLSSASEGFPYTVIEAMASGRATVSTDVGGVREAVGDAGLIVPPRDPAALADACVELLADDHLRRRLGAAARERVLTKFTLERFLDIYRGVYGGIEVGAAQGGVAMGAPGTVALAAGAA